jgi:SAM-dependent methyltransferase
MLFVVPPHFHRNAADVIAMAPPADTGARLIDYLARRLGRVDLAGLDVLDVGCGTRFADALINRTVPIGSYTGIDVCRPMVEFLQANAIDRRLSFHHFDAHNPHYNIHGAELTVERELPISGRRFDLICMFSVITHQVPHEANALFAVLRRYVRPDGRLFFTACIDDASGLDYAEHDPAHPCALSVYSSALVRRLLAETGWEVLSVVGPLAEDLPMLDSFLCAPGARSAVAPG